MGVFLAEGYVSSAAAAALARDGIRAATSPGRTAAVAARTRYLGAVLLPSDQTCLLLFEADCAQDVADACRRAGLPCERVTAAVIPKPRAIA